MQDFIYDRTQADVDYVKSLNASVWSGLSAEDREAFLTSLKGAFNYTDINRIASNINEIIDTYNLSLSTITQTWSENDDVIKTEIENVLNKISSVATSLNRPYVEGVLDYRGVNDIPLTNFDFEDLNNLEHSLAISYEWANDDFVDMPLDFIPVNNEDGSVNYYRNENLICVPAKATLKIDIPQGYFIQLLKRTGITDTPTYEYFRADGKAHYFNSDVELYYQINVFGGDYNFTGYQFQHFENDDGESISLNYSTTFGIEIDNCAYLSSHTVSTSTDLNVENYDKITFENVSITSAEDIEYQLIDDNDVIYDSGFITKASELDLTDMVTLKLIISNSATLDYRFGYDFTPTSALYRLKINNSWGEWLDYEIDSVLETNGASEIQVDVRGNGQRYAKYRIRLDGVTINTFNSMGVETFVFNNYYDANLINVLTYTPIYRCGELINVSVSSIPSGTSSVSLNVYLLDETEEQIEHIQTSITTSEPVEIETNGAVKCKMLFSYASGSVAYTYFSNPL